MPIILLLLLIFTFQVSTSAVSSPDNLHKHHRRQLLHQPFFPTDFVFPPTQPPSPTWSPQPQPQQQPKLPFSSSSSSSSSPPQLERPFFPSYHSPPPPPSPTALTSFPANISSILFPQTSSSHPHRRHRLALVVAASLLSAALIAAFAAAFLYHRRSKNHKTASTNDLDKSVSASRSDSLRLFPPNTATSDGGRHKSRGGTSNHSSEFLYLGTLVSSRGGGADHREAAAAVAANSSNAGIKIGVSSASPYRKLGSPELKPLPLLPKHNFSTYRRNGSDEGEDDEEFFSPRGSAVDTSSPGRVGSSSRREAPGLKVDNFGSRRSFNSRTTSYPCSKSPSPSHTTTSSPASLKSRSPDSIVNFIAPPPPPSRRPPSPSLSSSSCSLSERGLSPKKQSPEKQFVAVKLPPPPPPPPPARFWEIPAQRRRWSSEGSPVLVTPWRAFQNVERVSKEGEEEEHNVNVERNEEESLKKPKLKPLHWDKVRASSDRAMVWDHLKSSSFQLNEEMIETLFTANNNNNNNSNMIMGKENGRRQIMPPVVQENRVLDPKKSQNIAILLRALNVTIDEVCEALLEGNSDALGTELLESLLKMAPTKEEERRLRDYKDESPFKLGPAEKFLKAVLDIPFAFKRVDALLYITNFDSEVDYLKRSFDTLEVACGELKNNRMFPKLLEAVLKTGNRMNVGTNRGDAHAFKLDALLKLVDVKGADGKTTLLHFVVQEIIRAEGLRLSGTNQNASSEKSHQSSYWDDVEFNKLGLQVVSGLSGELSYVKKAAAMDSDVLNKDVAKLAGGISKVAEVLKSNDEVVLKESSSSQKFLEAMNGFLKKAAQEIEKLQTQERVALSLVKEITEYFHGNSAKEEARPLRIFMVVRDFLSILDQVCKHVGKVNERNIVGLGLARQFPTAINPTMAPVLFPCINGKQQQYGSSDDESSFSPYSA